MTEQQPTAPMAAEDVETPMRGAYARAVVAWIVSVAGLWLLQSCFGVS